MLAVLVLASGLGTVLSGSSTAESRAARRPNVLLVLVDDQAMNSFTPRLMPATYRWIVRRGTKFTSGLAAPPLCCPDRAGILTGQYPHNNGVFSNDPGYSTLTEKGDTLPVWLARAGYRTGFIGKFLNGYHRVAGDAPAPGFGTWFAYDDPTRYFNYTVSDDGTPRFFGTGRADYTTDVFTRRALRFIRAPSRKPFFLWLAYNAPHASHVPRRNCDQQWDPLPPDNGRYREFARLHLPRPPSFDEADVGDKPRAISSLPLLDRPQIASLIRRYRCTAAAMTEVDKGIDRIMHSLRHGGRLRNTIVFYLSDNGYFFGEHRIYAGKSYPYEPALRVPYAVRVPAAYRNRAAPHADAQVVSNQDVAATILDYAGVRPCAAPRRCRTIDGRTLRPLLGGGGQWPRDRGVLAEINANGIDYSALRTRRFTYAKYADGERELYDLRTDPFELESRAGERAHRRTERDLARRLAKLRRCSGHSGADPCE